MSNCLHLLIAWQSLSGYYRPQDKRKRESPTHFFHHDLYLPKTTAAVRRKCTCSTLPNWILHDFSWLHYCCIYKNLQIRNHIFTSCPLIKKKQKHSNKYIFLYRCSPKCFPCSSTFARGDSVFIDKRRCQISREMMNMSLQVFCHLSVLSKKN